MLPPFSSCARWPLLRLVSQSDQLWVIPFQACFLEGQASQLLKHNHQIHPLSGAKDTTITTINQVGVPLVRSKVKVCWRFELIAQLFTMLTHPLSSFHCDFSLDFLRCLDATNNNMDSCAYYLDALKQCQKAARPY